MGFCQPLKPPKNTSYIFGKSPSFTPAQNPRLNRYTSIKMNDWSSGQQSGAGGSNIEIEFKIYPDGRVEELVKGAKGKACIEITEAFNEKLGEIYQSKPTQEAFEQEVTVKNEDKVNVKSEWGQSEWWILNSKIDIEKALRITSEIL